MEWLRFHLGTIGLVVVLLDSTLLQGPRWWLATRVGFFRALLACYLCSGVWAAAGMWTLRRCCPSVYEPTADVLGAALLCYIVGLVLERLDPTT